MKTEPIQDYILKNEHNFSIASTVGEAWPQAREKLVAGFFDRLDSHLKKKLKGWKTGLWGGRFFVDAYPGFYIWKPAWEHHSVAFQCGGYGDRMVIGISRSTDDTRKLPLYAPLLSAAQKIDPSAKSQNWWEARINMHSPAPDWRKPDVLWRMHKDPKFLENVAEQLLALAKISEPIVDGLVRKYKK
jgi:hypothetical protein